ncbi:probable inactive receptor kinase At2g26730 [Humulus lupulus]|uniref:probable inactive receptor kinase At2g26730 n=1 Tax=Humulus lupulus TaxID=3486 RepID=UPI002B4092E3|nr:probable inactive receptor kinase At2g26730 [Humulus lupulus]
MTRIFIWAFLISIILVIPRSNSVEDEVKKTMVEFMDKLTPQNNILLRLGNWGWNSTSDPCKDKWFGVECDDGFTRVRKIVLEKLSFNGTFDASSLCLVTSITVLSLQTNNITGDLPLEIGGCKALTHLYLARNKFSGDLPDSLSQLSNLKRLHIEDNNFHGDLPNLSRISGLVSFVAENNELGGKIPDFDFTNFDKFNISNNNFSGQIPDVKGKFKAESFLGNPYLCGIPLPDLCPPPLKSEKPKKSSAKKILIYSGYLIMGSVILVFLVFIFLKRKKPREENIESSELKKRAVDKSSAMPSTIARSEYSLTSFESGRIPTLVVLGSPTKTLGLSFEELLKAPAELLGRGKHGSLYKVRVENGVTLAVKRIKNWEISFEEFDRRMRKLDQVKHRHVLPPVAFYCSEQEKLLVYDFQPNGSLFQLLHGSSDRDGQVFDWESRLSVAASISEALAFMHEELHQDRVGHGNLKSMNILFNQTMDPCISEYGLMVVENQHNLLLATYEEDLDQIQPPSHTTFKGDIYGFGVILLELLTGRLVQKNGFDLPNWVQSVVKEEWTVEVFDKALISEGASEERMVNLLLVALKCINPSPNQRPTMSQVSMMINGIKDEEKKSISFAL